MYEKKPHHAGSRRRADLTRRLGDPPHNKRASCECGECNNDRTLKGCENPHSCATAVASRLSQIHSNWIPRPGAVEDPVNVDEAPEQGDATSRFLSPKRITGLAQGLRVITCWDNEMKERPDPWVRRRAAVALLPEERETYIAGAVHAHTRSEDPVSGPENVNNENA
jgi:hypothetical protein